MADFANPVLSNIANEIYGSQPVLPDPMRLPQGGHESTVYLGLNDLSRDDEMRDLPSYVTKVGQKGVTDKNGKTVDLDVSDPKKLREYFEAIGVGGQRKGEKAADAEARMTRLMALFTGVTDKEGNVHDINVEKRDEMAEFVHVLQKVQNGEMGMERLILSGHSNGTQLFSGSAGNAGVYFDQIKQILKLFPKARNGVDDLMLSACHTLEKYGATDNSDGKRWKEMFPGLETMTGYDGKSPDNKGGAKRHQALFLQGSEGHDSEDLVSAMANEKWLNAAVKTY